MVIQWKLSYAGFHKVHYNTIVRTEQEWEKG